MFPRRWAACCSSIMLAMSVFASQVQAEPGQPNLFFDDADRVRIEARSRALPWLERTRQEILNRADATMLTPISPYPLAGSQNSLGTAGRALQTRLGALGFAAYLTGEKRYLVKGREILLAVVRQTEPGNPGDWQSHLQQGDAAQALVLGYDWLFPALSEAERREVRTEIEEFGRLLYEQDVAWGAPAPGVTSSNHNSVHFGALGLAALALGDQPAWLARAIERVRGYFVHFADKTGYVTEGHHYVGYGLGGAVPFSMALKRNGGPDLLAEADEHGLSLTGDQVLWKLLPFEGRMLSMNDSFERPGEVAALVGPLRTNRGDQLWAYLESIEKSGNLAELGGRFGITYTAPFLFLWGDEPVVPVSPAAAGLPLGHRFASGRVFLRSSWEGEDAAHASMTSGHDSHRGHDHQDENSVTFYAKGEGFLIDPQYWLETSDAHTTLSVEGVEQIKGGDGRIADYREDQRGALVRGQSEEAYDFSKVLIGQADRKMYFVRRPNSYIVLRDDMQVEKGGAMPFVSRYATYPGNRIEQYGNAVIVHGERRGGKALLAAFLGNEPVVLRQDDLSAAVVERRGNTFRYDRYLKRISAKFIDASPELISFVVPYEGDEPPRIEINAGSPRHSYEARVTFSDGHQDRLLIEEGDINLF